MIINKKGGMEMSINLIIIIIIALTVLGLVLGFVVSKFNQADTQFDIKEKLTEADYNTPITFSGDNLNLKPNKPTGKTISIYNYAQSTINLGKTENPDILTISCLPSTGIVTVDSTQNFDYDIPTGTTDTTQIVLTASGPKGDYSCKAQIKDAGGNRLLGSDVKLVIK